MLTLNKNSIHGHNLTIRANFRIETKELSGQTSSSDRSEEGIKPCSLAVSLQIPYKREKDLNRLRELATALNSSGNLQVYDIVNETASAMKVRQVTFMDNFTAAEIDGKSAWQVNFTLVEFLSIPEKKEQRTPQKLAVDQSAEGQPAGETSPPGNQDEQLTGAMAVLKAIDDALA